MRVEHLVVDSSGFIHKGPIRETGHNVYSCQEVLDEIKDQATLESLRFLPYELRLLQFDQDDLDQCIDFAKKTGDYRQLSAVDLKLIAATLRLEKLHNGTKYINATPKQVSVKALDKPKYAATSIDKALESLTKLVESASLNDKPVSEAELDKILEEEAGSSYAGSDEDEDSDDEKGWITPGNIKNIYQKLGGDRVADSRVDTWAGDRVSVACMTSDFSIQNCLLQMGLLVVSPVDGLMIKEAKKIALRCHACYKVFHDPSKIKNNFCPHCGNLDTLKRVQYIIEKDGSKRVIVNFKRPIRVKGTNRQLPRPRGGKKTNAPVLTADQRVRRDKQNKFYVDERKTLNAEHILNDPEYLVRSNPFAHRASRSTARRQ